MGKRWSLLALLLGLGVGLGATVSGPAGADDTDRVARLVKQLGSNRFVERDRAKRELEAIGMPALEALRRAARSKDLETSRRAGELVRRMEEKIALDRLLAPKKVRLKLNDTPVPDAVAELSRQSGYNIQIQGDRAILAKRKVTLDTGETTFWQALDQLCQKAGLVENSNPYNPYGVNPYIRGELLVPQQMPQAQILQLQMQQQLRMQQFQMQQLQIQPAPALAPQPPAPLPPAPPPPARKLKKGARKRAADAKVQVAQLAAPAQGKAAGGAPAKAPAPVQLQIQVQGGKLQMQPAPVLVQPAWGVQSSPYQLPYPTFGQFNLTPGKPQEVPTAYSGAVRVRALPQVPGVPTPAKRAGEATLTLEVAAEPRLQNFQLLGGVQIDKAVDDQGQSLTVPMDSTPGAGPFAPVDPLGGPALRVYTFNPYVNGGRITQFRLKLGERPAKTLKVLSGHISAQLLAAPEALITAEDVLKAAGKKFKGVGGAGEIEMLGCEKQADGSYRVQFRLEQPPNFIQAPFQGPVAPGLGNGAGGVVQIGGAGGRRVVRQVVNTHGLPTLVDAKGRSLQLTQVPTRMYRGGFGVLTMEVTMVFRRHDGQGEPARLVLHGQRNISVQVPFTLRDVPLP